MDMPSRWRISGRRKSWRWSPEVQDGFEPVVRANLGEDGVISGAHIVDHLPFSKDQISIVDLRNKRSGDVVVLGGELRDPIQKFARGGFCRVLAVVDFEIGDVIIEKWQSTDVRFHEFRKHDV